MNLERRAFKLNQLGFVGRGRSRHRPRNDSSLYGGPYPFFQTGDVTAAELYLHEYTQTYNEKGLAQSKLWKPGTLCITIAANIAETAILSVAGCFPDSVVGFVPHPDLADVKFIKYYIDTIKLQMQSASKGTTQDNLSLEKLLSFDFIIPNVYMQCCISGILSAYDDLIEINSRRIAIMEKMCKLTYEELFVSNIVPERLSNRGLNFIATKLGNVSDVIRGRTYKGSEIVDSGGMPFINLKCINREGGYRRSGIKRYVGKFKTNQTVRYGDIVMAVTDMTQERRIVARCARIPDLKSDGGVISMDLVKIDPHKNIQHDYLYAMLRWSGFADTVKNHATGANVLHLHPDCITSYEFFLPPNTMRLEYANFASPLFRQIENLESQNANLRAQRDLLLPKLISGQIDLSEAEEIAKEDVT